MPDRHGCCPATAYTRGRARSPTRRPPRAFLTRTFPDAELPDELPTERARAFFVPAAAPDGVLLMPPSGKREFAHLHDDGSLHLALPARARARQVVRAAYDYAMGTC
ncbi:luciferase domain-containing protein [Catenuloplanes japonicus]|uniref:luciferase domain-containing protein n=1 Tax=Catenuloplanes japonicus TaxID=33876 RepID=UPI000524BCA7|nr:luciferase family protein [Catenuloplanes japonicus]